MTMTLAELKQITKVDKLMIESHGCDLYTACVLIGSEEHTILTKEGKPLSTRNKLDMQSLFAKLPVEKTVLRHRSTFDEMIGHDDLKCDNQLEVPLGNSEFSNQVGDTKE